MLRDGQQSPHFPTRILLCLPDLLVDQPQVVQAHAVSPDHQNQVRDQGTEGMSNQKDLLILGNDPYITEIGYAGG